MKFKFVPHTADIKFVSYAKNLKDVFINSGLALKNAISKDKIKEKTNLKISVSGTDLLNLLYNFLEEIIFLFDSKSFILSKIKNLQIDKKNFKIICIFSGDFAKNYNLNIYVKAVTYNEMLIEKKDKLFRTIVVLDI